MVVIGILDLETSEPGSEKTYLVEEVIMVIIVRVMGQVSS